MINNFKQFLNEGFDDYIILDDSYFIKRIPFFKSFENQSGDSEVRFNHYKNWSGEDSAILHFGKGNGFVKFPYLSVEANFISQLDVEISILKVN